MSKELTYKETAEHSSKKDLYMVIHDKIYDVTSFVDEHPGGEEVLLDVGGQDATEAFEDVGHSDEAREILDKLIVGSLKRVDGDPEPPKASTGRVDTSVNTGDAGAGSSLWVIILVGAALAYGGYIYMQNNQQTK